MAKDEDTKAVKPDIVTAQNMHNTFLEALRHREQEILRFMAILAPALGGFIWLLTLNDCKDNNLYVFSIGTIGVLFLLAVGAVYSLALGYNYRCITLQVAKLEATCLGFRNVILNKWPRKRDDFIERSKLLLNKPYYEPPEIIKVFWYAFIVGVFGVTLASLVKIFSDRKFGIELIIWATAIVSVAAVFIWVIYKVTIGYGNKFKEICTWEPTEWKPLEVKKRNE